MLSERAKAFSVESLLKKRPLDEAASKSMKSMKLNINHDSVPQTNVNIKNKQKVHCMDTILTSLDRSGELEKNLYVYKQFSHIRNRQNVPSEFFSPYPCAPKDVLDPLVKKSSRLKCTLANSELWSEFYKHQTEMIITKTGRYIS